MSNLNDEQGVMDFVAYLFPMFKRNIMEHGHLTPVAFVFVTKHPETGEDLPEPAPIVVAAGMDFDQNGKDTFANTLKTLAQKLNAVGLVFATEAWTVASQNSDEVQKAMNMYAGRFGEHPMRKEIIMVSLEHKNVPGKMWQAKIEREVDADDSTDIVNIGEFEQVGSGNLAGRFTHLLG